MALHLYRHGAGEDEIAFRLGTSIRWLPYYFRVGSYIEGAETRENLRRQAALEERQRIEKAAQLAERAEQAERDRREAERRRIRRLSFWYYSRRLNGIGRPLDMAGPRGVWLEFRIGDPL